MVHYLSKQRSLYFDPDIDTDITVEGIIEALKTETELALDTETTGIDPKVDSIIMLQFGTHKGNQFVIDTRDYNIELFREILEDPNKTFVGHNIKFDYNMLKSYRILLTKVYDTMVVDKAIYNGMYEPLVIMKTKRFSLASVYNFYFNQVINKGTRDEFQFIGTKPFTLAQIRYGANDVLYPFQIQTKQLEKVQEYNLGACIRLENKLVLVLGDIEYNGFHLNKDKWKQITVKYASRLKITQKKLDNILLESAPQYKIDAFQQDLFDSSYMNQRECKVNWSSDKQVYEILTTVYGIHPKDKHGKPSSGAPAIHMLPEENDITNLILKYREEEKVITSFGLEYLEKYLSDSNRIHTSYNQIVDTGRMSSRKPNLQQIPNYNGVDDDTKLFREAFEAPDGKLISTADYASQEGRIMADAAKDDAYITFFKIGDGDAHSFVATKMFSAAFGKEFIVTKHNENSAYRQKGKILNFFVSFGGSAYTLSQTLKIPKEEAQELIDAFYKGFPTLKAMFEKNKCFGIDKGYITTNTITNRLRWFPEWHRYLEIKAKTYASRSKDEFKEMMRIKGNIERRAMNTPIQGTAGDMTKTALVIIRDRLLNDGILPYDEAEVKIVSVVHDECSLEISENLAKKYSKVQQESMEEAGGIFVKSMPMPATSITEKYWTH